MKREKLIAKYPTTDGQVLKIALSYHVGGSNYFSGNQERRGYYVRVTPVKIEVHGGIEMESFMLFSGIKKFLKPAARFSQKELDRLTVDDATIAQLVAHVCDKEGLKLAQIEAAHA